jgi:hypothetical protein
MPFHGQQRADSRGQPADRELIASKVRGQTEAIPWAARRRQADRRLQARDRKEQTADKTRQTGNSGGSLMSAGS